MDVPAKTVLVPMDAFIQSNRRLKEIMEELGEMYFSIPPSLSKKNHLKEVSMREHIERTFILAQLMCLQLKPDNAAEILEAAILHDIGKIVCCKKGPCENGKYYPATGYSYVRGVEDHGTEGAKLLRERGFPESICKMVENHMSHWDKKKPETIGECIVSLADYLSSRDNIIIDY